MDKDLVPADLAQVEIDVPGDVAVTTLEAGSLPPGWRCYPAPPELQRLGDDWLAARSTLVLRVPSAVIPREDNLLLNPLHPDAARLTVVSEAPFSYDLRLLG